MRHLRKKTKAVELLIAQGKGLGSIASAVYQMSPRCRLARKKASKLRYYVLVRMQ